MFAWCSSQVMTISSSCPTLRRPQLCATRLMPSVVPRTKTISRVDGGIEEAPHLLARASYASVARAASVCAARWTFEFSCSIEVREAIDDRLRLLRRRRVVEPDERASVNLLLQDREISLDHVRIVKPLGEADVGN